MFARRKRFSREEFPLALRAGKRISSEHFTALLPEHATGYAIVVPKKVARLSVTRHRIKRQLSGVLERVTPLPPALILFPRPSAVRLDTLHLHAALMDLLTHIPSGRRAREK